MQLTILFESPFYVGIVEQEHDGLLFAARHVFGPAPSNEQIYAFVQAHLDEICAGMTAGVPANEAPVQHPNPKRRQRQIAQALQAEGVTSRAHDAMRLQIEQGKQARQKRRTKNRAATREQRWQQRQARARRKRRGK